MLRLNRPLVDLYCLTGKSMDAEWLRELSCITIPNAEELAKKQQARIKAIYRGERIDRLPFSADLRWWFCEHHHDGTLLKDLAGIDLGKVFAGPVPKYSPPKEEPEDPLPGVEEEIIWSGKPVKYVNGDYPGSVRTVELRTKYGMLTATEKYAGRSFGITEHPVKSAEDLKIVRFIYEQRAKHSIEPNHTNWYPSMTPIQAFLIELAGIERAIYILYDSTREVEATMDCMEEAFEPVFEFLAKNSSADMIISTENISADISAGYWDEYLAPQLSRRAEVINKHGKVYGIHHDGVLLPILGWLGDVGIGLVNGVTSKPSGDVDPLELREIAGPDMILWDILPQIIFTPVFSDQEFEAYVKRVVEFYREDNRIVLGIGDMLPANGKLERVVQTVEIIDELS